MIDRLEDFKRLLQRKGIKQSKQSDTIINVDNQNSEDVNKISALFREGNNFVNKINELTEELKTIRYDISKSSGDKEREIKKSINQIEDKYEYYRREAKIKADEMKSAIVDFKIKVENIAADKKIPDYGCEDLRMVNNLYGALLKNFENSINSASSVTSEIKIEQQNKLIRDAENILGEISEDKKAEIIKDPNVVNELLENKLTQGLAHVTLKNKVRELEERHLEIVRLENNINQMHRLFLDLAILVQQQGEIIDNIEKNIENAKYNVAQAEIDLKKAEDYQKAARKKKCCILMIVIGILIVILIPVLTTQLTKA